MKARLIRGVRVETASVDKRPDLGGRADLESASEGQRWNGD